MGSAPGSVVSAGKPNEGALRIPRNGPLLDGGLGSAPVNRRGPSSVVSLHTTFFIACGGFTHGPPVTLHPPLAAIDISRPRRCASAAACRNAALHGGVIHTSRFSTNCGVPSEPSNICIPPIPTRFIHSRSAVIPSRVTLPFIQCHQTRGLASSGGVRAARSRAEVDCANALGVATAIAAATPRRRRRVCIMASESGERSARAVGSSRLPERLLQMIVRVSGRVALGGLADDPACRLLPRAGCQSTLHYKVRAVRRDELESPGVR